MQENGRELAHSFWPACPGCSVPCMSMRTCLFISVRGFLRAQGLPVCWVSYAGVAVVPTLASTWAR